MPNPNSPWGLEPIAFMSGAPYNGAVRTYYVPASNVTALFIGDPVISITNSSDGNGVQSVGIATAGSGNMVLGSFRGITNNAGQPVITLLQSQPPWLAAGVGAYVMVSDDPTLLYEVQEDSAAGANLVSGANGRNVNLIAGAGNQTFGLSGWQIQTSSLATGPTLQMRIIEFQQRQNNAIGVNGKWLCKINDAIHPWTQGTGI